MRRISKQSLLVLLAVVVSLATTPLNVFAASAYDNVYQTTDDWTLSTENSPCSPRDVISDWVGILMDSTFTGHPGDATRMQERRDSYQDLLNNPGNYYWAVSAFNGTSYASPNNDVRGLRVYWTERTNDAYSEVGYYNWTTSAVSIKTVNPIHSATIHIIDGSSSSPCAKGSYNGAVVYPDLNSYSTAILSGSGGSAFNIYLSTLLGSTIQNPTFTNIFSTFPVNYPSGYEGVSIPDSAFPPIALAFTYDIQGLNVTVKSTITNPPSGSSCWWVFDTDPSQAGDSEISQDITDSFDCSDPDSGQFVYRWLNYGDYHVFLYLQSGTVIKNTNVMFHIDGSSSTGTADDEGKHEHSIYEQCDLVDISCHFRNFGNLLMFLFKPDVYRIQASFDNFISQVKTSFGFLWAPFDFIIQLFGLVTANAVNPTGSTCSLGDITLFSSPAEIHLCAWRYQLPQLWSYMQIALQGGIAISFVFAFWRKFNGIFGNHIEEYDDSDDYSGAEWVDERTGERGSIHDGSAGRRGGSR